MAYDGIMMHQVKNLLIETIKGGRINKIYQISKYELLFQVRANKKNYQLLISSHPMYARVQLTSLSYPTPESPNPLTMLYRKLLEGGYIKDIEQIDLDRIFKITFSCHNELGDYIEYVLYVEVMGKHSNIIGNDDSMNAASLGCRTRLDIGGITLLAAESARLCRMSHQTETRFGGCG